MVAEPIAALMSIRRPYSSAILEGKKLVELRRAPIRRAISHVVIYESRGSGQIVGFFEVKRILERNTSSIWKRYNGTTGLSKKEFDAYYKGKKHGVVIEVGKVFCFDKPLPLEEISIERPPQSFQYICCDMLKHILDRKRFKLKS